MEEVGSFKLETNEQSVSYQVIDGDGRQMHGIIDEMDSDTERGYTQKRGASRNVSIVSASEDDASVGYAREVSVDEFQRDFQFEDGSANVFIKRTVIDEEEMYVASAGDDNDDVKRMGKLFEVKETDDDEIDEPLPTKVKVTDISKGNATVGGKAVLCDVEEKEEHSSLTAEEAKQLRIKEIRAKARKASIVNKEDMTTDTVDDNRKTAQISDQPHAQAKNANLLQQEGIDEHDSVDKGSTAKQAQYESLKENEKPQTGKQRQINEVELDDDFEKLMKRAQRQRSILNDILDKEHGISSEEEYLQKSSLIDSGEECGSGEPGIT